MRRCGSTTSLAAIATALLASAALGAMPASAQEQDPPQDAEGELDVPAPPEGIELPEIEPVITDEEFDSAVPDLDLEDDPELSGPLESIEEFERRIAEDEADVDPTDGQAPPLGDPALADGDRQEEIGDAKVRDAELAAPLPPLEDFEVRPVEFAQEADDTEVFEIEYGMRVNGLELVDAETPTNMRDMFDDFSALEAGDGEAANAAQVSARLIEDGELMKRILASEGWYDARITTRLDRSGAPNGQPLTAVIDVIPGQRYVFSDIVIDANPTAPETLIRDAIALEPGQPIIATRVQGAEANVAVTLPESGYPFAEVGQRDLLLVREDGEGVYTLPVETGPRSSFGEIRTSGDLAFDAEHIATIARFERGELYDSRMIDDLRKALVATGLLNTVSVTPEESGEAVGDGTEYATILVEQQAGPPRTIAGTAGYETGQGFRVEGSWTHRNMFPPEGALIASGVAGTSEQGAGLIFRRSNAGKRDRVFQIAAEALRSDFDAYEAFTGRVSALISYDSTSIWQKTLTYAFGVRIIGTNEQDYNFEEDRLDRRTFGIAGLNGQIGLDFTDSLLDPTEGFRVTALVEPEGSLQDSLRPYVRARVDGSAYYSPSDSIVLAVRASLGTIQGIDRFDLAPSRRLYAGGGGSVRGFAYQELGPKVSLPNPNFDPDDPDETADPFRIRPLGGRSLNEAAAELRYRFGNFGVVGFVDVGQVYESTSPQFDDLRYGVGLGGRYYTNFGPLRLDIATPINRREGESKLNVYVSIGQAF